MSSLPQRLPISSGIEKEKSSPLSSMFPGMQFCIPPVTSAASVFPMFPPNFQQLYANLFQQQLMHLAAQQQQSPALRSDLSPSLSDRGSSGTESPSVKKLQLDEDGSPICPICSQKLPESEWSAHVEMEKRKLKESICNVKENRMDHSQPQSSGESMRRKRENELARIRSNQQKRLALKRSIISIRESVTPFGSRQSVDESGSRRTSPDVVKKEEVDGFGNIKCFTCARLTDYGIISSSFEHPRCQECFNSLRTQTCGMPTTFSGSPIDMRLNVSESSGSGDLSPPVEKRMKME